MLRRRFPSSVPSSRRTFRVLGPRAGLALALACSNVAAEPPPPDVAPERAGALSLTVEEAIARAEARAPSVRLATHALAEANARRVGAGLVVPANPRVSLEARPPLRGDWLGSRGWAGTVEVPLDLGGAPAARVREARRLADVATVDVRVERAAARAAAWTAYVRSVIAAERIGQTQALVGIAERILAASEERERVGASAEIEQSLARGELAELGAELEATMLDREQRIAELREVLDAPAGAPLVLSSKVEEPTDVPKTEALVERALARRPELEADLRRVALLDATDERLSRETFPRIGPFLGVDAAPDSPTFGIVGVSVEIPVWQRNQGPRAVVRATRAAEVERRELDRRRIAREVATARAEYESARARLDALTRRALPAVERTLELAEAGWRSGRFDLFRLTSAARDVARVRGLRLQALESAWVQRIALDRAVGGLDR